MQFYAIEISRNRAGLNDWIKEACDKEEAEKAKKKEEEEKKKNKGKK